MRHANNEKTEYICVNQVAGRIVRKDALIQEWAFYQQTDTNVFICDWKMRRARRLLQLRSGPPLNRKNLNCFCQCCR